MFKRNNTFLENTPWGALSAGEGILHVFNLSLLKVVAHYFVSAVLSLFAIFVIGFVRMIGGAILTLRSGYEFFPSQKAVFGSMLVGLVSAYVTLIPVYLFVTRGISIAVFALMIFVGLIPGAVWNKLGSYGKLSLTQIFGLILSLLSLVAVMQFAVVALPIWFWLILSLPVASLVQEIIIRKIGTAGVISPWVHNFWLGLSMIIFAVVGMMLFNASLLSGAFLSGAGNYIIILTVIGISSLAIVLFRQKSFMQGGSFGSKNTATAVVMILTALLVDTIFFSVYPSIDIFLAVILLFIGYPMIESKNRSATVEFVTSKD